MGKMAEDYANTMPAHASDGTWTARSLAESIDRIGWDATANLLNFLRDTAHASEQGADTNRLLKRIRKFILPRTECAQDSDIAKKLVADIDAAMSQRTTKP